LLFDDGEASAVSALGDEGAIINAGTLRGLGFVNALDFVETVVIGEDPLIDRCDVEGGSGLTAGWLAGTTGFGWLSELGFAASFPRRGAPDPRVPRLLPSPEPRLDDIPPRPPLPLFNPRKAEPLSEPPRDGPS
jgi:hypothetical protein